MTAPYPRDVSCPGHLAASTPAQLGPPEFRNACFAAGVLAGNLPVGMKADFSIKPTLTGPNVVLRPFTGGALAAMSQALLDPEVGRLTGSVHDETAEFAASTPEQDEVLRDWYATRNDQRDRLDWRWPIGPAARAWARRC